MFCNVQIEIIALISCCWMSDICVCSNCNLNKCFGDILGNYDVTILNDFNNNEVFPKLQTLLNRPYFRYFQYNSRKKCGFLLKSKMGTCKSYGCRVKPCGENDIPSGIVNIQESDDCFLNFKKNDNRYDVDSTITAGTLENLNLWNAHDSEIINFCDPDGCKNCDIVDLTINPERYTGYEGKPAAEMWQIIYQSGFSLASKGCEKQKAFFCSISGLQSSIGIHIASQYPTGSKGFSLDVLIGNHGPSLEEFSRRFTRQKDGNDWIRNLYFVYLVELKALSKADNYLRSKKIFTGNSNEDMQTQSEVGQILDIIQTLPNPINQTTMVNILSGLDTILFNTSQVMDCIECDKCKLWGKLQVAGFGTALKILSLSNTHNDNWNYNYQLSRNEVVSLWNALGRISTSIFQLEYFSTNSKTNSEL